MISLNEFMKAQLKYNFKVDKRYIIKVSNRSRYTKDIANKALNNEIIPFPNFDSFKMNNYNGWNKRNQKYGNSYQLYIHTFRFINELLLMYEETNDHRYLNKAKEYIYEWYNFVTNYKTTSLVWYDHSVAQRTQVLIFYLYLSGNKIVEQELFGTLLEYHALFMMDEKNYKYNNHSLMMDRSLMLIGLLLNNENYFNIGFHRSKDTFWRSFSKNGLHLENSPDYHLMVTNMYKEMEEVLNQFNKSYGKLINDLLSKADCISGLISLPTEELPIIGDTNNNVIVPKTSYNDLIDYEAGLAILQNETLYMAFISGYSTITHKHHDDLSFILMYKKMMIFDDGGKYNYSNDETRKYMLSIQPHSNIHVNNEDYKLDEHNIMSKKVKISHHFSNDDYVLIKGQNLLYSDVEIYRTVVFLKKENIIILFDEVYTTKEVTITHNFNLSHKIDVSNYHVNSLLKIEKDYLSFKEYLNHKELHVYNSKNSKEDIVNSVGMNKSVPTNRLRLEEQVKNESKNIFIISNKNDFIEIELFQQKLFAKVNDMHYIINI